MLSELAIHEPKSFSALTKFSQERAQVSFYLFKGRVLPLNHMILYLIVIVSVVYVQSFIIWVLGSAQGTGIDLIGLPSCHFMTYRQ